MKERLKVSLDVDVECNNEEDKNHIFQYIKTDLNLGMAGSSGKGAYSCQSVKDSICIQSPSHPQPRDEGMSREAMISDDGLYRYTLTREWEGGSGCVNWVMLNPSTADHLTDDATIRRCIRFSQDWGFKSLIVTNLFAFRATNPQHLIVASDPIGPRNDWYLENSARGSKQIILAWGNWGEINGRNLKVMETLYRYPCFNLGYTKTFQPRHPLYLKSTVTRIPVTTAATRPEGTT